MAKPRKHSEEFKREAVRMMMSRGERSIEDVARSLGIVSSLLGKWHTKYASSVKAAPRAGKETAEQLELKGTRLTLDGPSPAPQPRPFPPTTPQWLA
jgi:transposase-like protein